MDKHPRMVQLKKACQDRRGSALLHISDFRARGYEPLAPLQSPAWAPLGKTHIRATQPLYSGKTAAEGTTRGIA
eukprot:14759724-Alexandrium_andersonii.AAC.1